MRRFYLERETDESGISGTGVVAQGLEFDSGQAVLTWLSNKGCVAVYDCVKVLKDIHGHGGQTKLVWIDPPAVDDERIEENLNDENT